MSHAVVSAARASAPLHHRSLLRRAAMIAALCTAALVASGPAGAVDVKVVKAADGRSVVFELSGPYVAGDGLKLRGEVAQLPAGTKIVAHLLGGSGSFTEAMSIGRLFHSRGIPTVVPPKARCISPCHLVLVGGRSTDKSIQNYVKHSSGVIGFSGFTDSYTDKEYGVNDLYAAVESTQQGILKVADYLTEVGADLELLRHTYDETTTGQIRIMRDEAALEVGISVFDDNANRLIDSRMFRRKTQ
jgi:hypothetical protein